MGYQYDGTASRMVSQLTGRSHSADDQPLPSTRERTKFFGAGSPKPRVSKTRLQRRIQRFLLLTLAVSLTCKESTGPESVAAIYVYGPALLYAGDSVAFTTLVTNSQGDTLPSAGVTWSSSAPTVATVDRRGEVHGVAPGQTSIEASDGGKSTSHLLSVQLTPVAKIVVTPAVDSLFPGSTLQLTLAVLDGQGRPLVGRAVTWASSDTTKGTVSDSGLVTARSAGSFAVTATSEGVQGGAFLNTQQRAVALLLPDSFHLGYDHLVRFIADLRSASGTHLSGRSLTWTSSDSNVARIDSTGLVTPKSLGLTEIRASSNGLADSTRLRVVPEAVVQISVPTVGPLSLGHPDTVTVLPSDSAGKDAVGNPVTWSSGDTSLLKVSPLPNTDRGAVLLPLRAGVASVTVSCGARSVRFPVSLIINATEIRFLQDTIFLPVGDVKTIPAVTRDTLGGLHEVYYYEIAYTSTDSTIAAVVPGDYPQVRGVRAGQTRLIATSGSGVSVPGVADTATVIVQPAGTRSLVWAPTSRGVFNYDTVQVQLAWDTTGIGSYPPAHAVTITSSDTTIIDPIPVSLTLNGTATITVRGHRVGTALLTARTDSTFQTFAGGVFSDAASALLLSPRPHIVLVGDTVTLIATASGGLGVHAFPITFSSSDTSKASISPAGFVVFKDVGSVRLRATTGSVGDSLTVEVGSPGIRIDSISPGTLIAGSSATLYGAGFSPTTTNVVVAGVSAVVGAATTGILPITVPPTAAFPCLPTHEALVVVTAAGQVAADSFPLLVAEDTLALSPGGVTRLGDGANRCVALSQNGAVYRISVTNTATDASSFELGWGSVGPGAVPSGPIESVVAPVTSRLIDSLTQVAQLHQKILEANRALALRLGPPVPSLLAARRAAGPAPSPSATIGGIAEIRIPRIDQPDFCASYTSIQARLVYSGTHTRIYEDVNAPLAKTMDSAYAAVGAEFDLSDYPVLFNNFGDPLALDTLLDASGKLTMVFSPVTNGYGVSGFVTACDFYPEALAPSSNTTEIFYGPVPTAPGTGFTAYTPAVWKWTIRAVVMHESKHIASYAAHLAQGAPLEETWLEEGSAVLAEELWARPLYGAGWKTNTTYSQSLYCDVRPTWSQCYDRPYVMFDAFALFYDYAQHHQTRTPLGPVSPSDVSFYGSAWSYLRWAVDQYAGSESAFLRGLTQATVTGSANLSAQTGHSSDAMLADWFTAWSSRNAVALGTLPSAPYNFPSWVLVDIFSGMHTDFPNDFAGFPGDPVSYTTYGSTFTDTVSAVPPGGSASFQLTNRSTTPLVVHLTSPGGLGAPGGLRIEFYRVK